MSRPCLALDDTGRAVAFPLRHVTGVVAVLTRVRVALEVVRGFWPEDVEFGLPLLQWVAAPNTPLIEYEATVRSLLGSIQGVISVVAIAATRIDEDVHFSIRLQVQDDDEVVEALVGTTDTVAAPGAWFTLIRARPVVF